MHTVPPGLSNPRVRHGYAAGLWTADGWGGGRTGRQAKSAGGAPSHRLIASVVNTDRRLPEWLKAHFGGSVHHISREGNRRKQHRWDAERQTGYDFFSHIRPLVPHKLPPLLLAMALRDHKRQWRQGVKLTAGELEQREAFCIATRAWNHRKPIPSRVKRLIAGSVRTFDQQFLTERSRLPKGFDDPVDRAIWAGCFDGDASLYLRQELDHPDRQTPKFSLAPNVCLGNKDLAGRLSRLLDSGPPIPRRDANGNVSTYVVTAYSSKPVRFLKAIQPYSFKEGQIEILLEFQKRHHRHGSGGPGNTVPPNVIAWRKAAWTALRHLRALEPIPEELQNVLAEGGDFGKTFPKALAASRCFGENRAVDDG